MSDQSKEQRNGSLKPYCDDNPNVLAADALECVERLVTELGVNQVLFHVVEAIERRAEKLEPCATRTMLDQLVLDVGALAFRAQRAGL
ncbi:MAG: hypothetical protein FJ399_08605 [Verrucomicrobia bacterium]|nr:hypothetical protein [Verrucomicrobiota bacterium]